MTKEFSVYVLLSSIAAKGGEIHKLSSDFHYLHLVQA